MKLLSKLFHNKSIVTLISLIVCIIVLFVAYNYRVNTAIHAIDVPIALRDLQPREEITEESFETIKIAQSMITNNVIRNKNDLIGKYVNYNTFIPKGGMFYTSAVVTWDQMPDSAWADIQEGYTIFSLKVTTTTTYGNSIYPGDKIDLYYQNTINGKTFLGPLIEGIEVLAVKDENGSHIFKKSAEQKNASALIFSVPDYYILYHLLLYHLILNNYLYYLLLLFLLLLYHILYQNILFYYLYLSHLYRCFQEIVYVSNTNF